MLQLSFRLGEGKWNEIKDGNPSANALYRRHYSAYKYKDGRQPSRFAGPGEKIVLLTPDSSALFVWRKFKPMDNQQGVNCAVFRNEGALKSSDLILEAERFALKRWGNIRAYTYVHPLKIKSANPGYCFKVAGWRQCGVTKVNKLIILEKEIKPNTSL